MKFFNSMSSANRMIMLALGISIISGAVAIGSVMYAMRFVRTAGMPNAPVIMQEEERASARAPMISSYGGYVVSVSPTMIAIGTANGPLEIRVVPATEISEQGAQKSQAQYQKELDAFLETIRDEDSSNDSFFAPQMYETRTLSISDIAVGNAVRIEIDDSTPPAAIVITRVSAFPTPAPAR